MPEVALAPFPGGAQQVERALRAACSPVALSRCCALCLGSNPVLDTHRKSCVPWQGSPLPVHACSVLRLLLQDSKMQWVLQQTLTCWVADRGTGRIRRESREALPGGAWKL